MALTLLALYPVLFNDWVNWDDPQYVTQNTHIRDFSAEGLAALFQPENRALDTYTPLTLLSFAVDYAMAGTHAPWYHGINLLLHLLNVWLVFVLIARMTGRNRVAFFVAVLFGLHPLHVESVAWVTERKDLLFSVFFLGACVLYFRTLKQQVSWGWPYWLALLLGALAMLAKPQAVTLPLVLMLLHYWHAERFSREGVLHALPFFGLSAATGVLALSIMQPNPSDYTLLERVCFSGHATMVYVYKLIAPVPLVHDMGRPDAGAMPWYYHLNTLLSVLLLGGGLWLGRKHRSVVVGNGLFVVLLFFSLHLFKINSGVSYDRFTYLPYIGLLLMIGVAVDAWAKRSNVRWLPLLTAVVIVGFGAVSHQRCSVWQNDDALWSNVLEHRPNHPTAHCKRASYLSSIGELDVATAAQLQCLALNPGSPEVLTNLGIIQRNARKPAEALASFNRAIELDPSNPLPYVNRGMLRVMQAEFEAGLADLEAAVERAPEHPTFRINLGIGQAFYLLVANAQQQYQHAIELDPNNGTAWQYLGALHLAQGNPGKAVAALTEAVRLVPTSAQAWYSRAQAHLQLGNRAAAAEDARAAQAAGHPLDAATLPLLQ